MSLPVRDQFATAENLETIIASCEHFIATAPERLVQVKANNPRQLDSVVMGNWEYHLQRLGARYSLGVSVDDLRADFALAVSEAPYVQWRGEVFSNLSTFLELIWLAAWSRLLDDGDSRDVLRDEYAKFETSDLLVEAFLSDDPATIAGPISLVLARQHRGLGEAIELSWAGDHDAASERLRRYVSAEWYRGFRGFYWWGSHTRMINHKGYWAYEAAAVAVTFGIDDSALKTHKYYPWDLAHAQTSETPDH